MNFVVENREIGVMLCAFEEIVDVYASFSKVVRPCVLGGCVKMSCRYSRVVWWMKRVLILCMWSSSGVRFMSAFPGDVLYPCYNGCCVNRKNYNLNLLRST